MVVLFVSPLSASRSLRISLCSQWAAHVLCICGGSGLVYVDTRTFRSNCDLVASLPRVALFFFPQARTQRWCPRVFQLTACCRVAPSFVVAALSQGRWWREARRNACAAKLRTPWPSDPALASSVGAREGQEVLAQRRLWDTAPHQRKGQCLLIRGKRCTMPHWHAHRQIPAHTQVRVAMWRTRTCTRRPFADFETLGLMIFAMFRAIRKLNYPS